MHGSLRSPTSQDDPAGRTACGQADKAELTAALRGLSAQEAAQRLRRCGPNHIDPTRALGPLRLLGRQFASPLVLILVVGAAVSLGLRQWVDAGIILLIVSGSAGIGFAQEARAEAVIDVLRQQLAPTAQVLRDGQVVTLDTRQIVPGDIVMLKAGAPVPADGEVLDSLDCLVEEARLTGESFPVAKEALTSSTQAGGDTRVHTLFLGTSVRSGLATMRVTATGRQTLLGRTAASLGRPVPPTAFERGLTDFGALLLKVMVTMVIFVLAVNHALGRPAIESLLFAVALAVGLSPELLPAIVSVTLAQGARRMALRGTLVRRLQAIENLGGIDVLCTDKTGTLTEGRVVLHAALDVAGAADPQVLQLAWLNASLQSGIENPLDTAILEAGMQAGLTPGEQTKVAEMPYDFARRRLSIVCTAAHDATQHRLITKGAVDSVLSVCSHARVQGQPVPLDRALRTRIEADCVRHGQDGIRVLAVASRDEAAHTPWQPADETGLTLEGFVTFLDPPRADASEALRALRASGVRVVLITGDTRWVAAHLARCVAIDPERVLCGADLATMDDAALAQRVLRTDVFAQIDPLQKARIVTALQSQGHIVGFLGDGINDVAALHAADVGISVQGAVQIARERADVVLTQSDLSVLHEGILEGRRTFANTLKYISITTSANFGNMISMAIATPLLPFLPLAVKQILLNNFLSDLPSMALAADRVDAEQLARPQRWDQARIRRFMLVFGLISTAFDLLAFFLLRRVFAADTAQFQTSWFITSVLTELAVVGVLRTSLPVWRSRPGTLLACTTLAVAALAMLLPWWPALGAPFGLVALPLPMLGAMLGVVVGYIVVTEAVKRLAGWST